MTRHALISGASIAGPALAHQLAARGWRTTVLERAPQRREEGHNIDVRGAAREVARRMGIEDDIRAANTREIGMRFVDDDGSPVASFPMAAAGRVDGPTAELEILRGELSRILYEHTCGTTEYRFSTQITELTDHGGHVTAALDDGTAIDADLVVIAEGLRSRTRDLVLPLEVTELGMYIAYFTIPRRDSDDQWWNWHHVPGSRAVHLRPDNLGTTRAMLSFLSDVRGLEDLDRADQIAILRRTFADVGGAAPRILAELDARAAVLRCDRPGARCTLEPGADRPPRRRGILRLSGRRGQRESGPHRRLRPGGRAVPHRRPPLRVRPLRRVHAPPRRQCAEGVSPGTAGSQSPHRLRHSHAARIRAADR